MSSQQALQLMSSPKSSQSKYQDETGEMYLRRKLKEWYSSDRPKHNCDGRGSNDRLLPTYGTFEFQLGAASRDEIKELWERNCQGIEKFKGKPERPKEAARIGLFIGAPGIGKTRTLLELKTILPCGKNYVYVSFNGTTPFAPEEHANFDQMVAIRILWGSFERWNSGSLFRQWAAKFDYRKNFTTTDCLEIIRKEEGPFCLAIDEVSRLNEMTQRACNEIKKTVLTSHTVVFLGGTLRNDWEDALTGSTIPSRFLSLAPLSSAQVSNILDKLQPPYAKYFNGWRTNTHLRDLLLRIGGVPRLLDDFVRKCDKKFKDHLSWNWNQMDAILEEIDPNPGLETPFINRLVKDIILRKQVSRRDPVIKDEPSKTYDRLQSQGFIQLLAGDSIFTCFVFVPFVRLRQWVTALVAMTDHEFSFEILNDLMTWKVEWGYWMDFEKITAQYFQLLIYMWSEEAKRGPENRVTWTKFFNMNIPGWRDIQFINGSPDVITCFENQNHNEYDFDDGSVFVNAPGAPFADVFFTCRYGKRRTKYLVAIQCKLLNKTAMTKRILNEEVNKNGDCSDMLTVILVTAPYTDHGNNQGEGSKSTAVDGPMTRKRPMEADKPKEAQNYIILDRIQLQRFFPIPLRDYTFRAMSSGRLNINCAPLDDVTKLFELTEGQAKTFVEKRQSTGGFTRTDELPFKVKPNQSALIEF
jgi:hypothetical protein